MNNIVVHDRYGNENNEVTYNCYDFPYKIIFDYPYIKSKNTRYINCACAFDIESTTILHATTPYGFMYHWQICIDKYVCFGRTWDEFTYFINKIQYILQDSPDVKLVFYVHNLSYEFQFIKNFIQITSLFAREKGRPVFVRTPNIEFRCSYYLTNKSLDMLCKTTKGCTYYKKSGQTYNYNIIRTPYTPMKPHELEYCYCDVRGLCQCIWTLLEEDDISTIPLTSTGYVRREFREAVQSNPLNRKKFIEIQLNEEMYEMCKEAFRGGDTGSSMLYVGDILEDVHSADRQSSYPAEMLLAKYPMTKFVKVSCTSLSKFKYYINNKACLFRVVCKGLKVKNLTISPYQSTSKSRKIKNGKFANGRVLSADSIEMTLTDIDWQMIDYEYDIDEIIVKDMYISEYGYLNDEFRYKLLEYFRQKTLLKVEIEKLKNNKLFEEAELLTFEYNKFKNKINSSFGMMVTDIATPDIIFDSTANAWDEEECSVSDKLKRYYRNKNAFLSYQHGVWITAHARHELRKAMYKIGSDHVYNDTDSTKHINNHKDDIAELNNELYKRIENCDIDIVVNIEGKNYYLGEWEIDGDYQEFTTMGSKKYLYKEDNEYHLTLAGVNKKLGSEWLSHPNERDYLDDEGNITTVYNFGCDAFQKGLIIPTEICKRTTSYYNDEPIHYITVGNDTFKTASNIGVVNVDYTLGITDEYEELITKVKGVI